MHLNPVQAVVQFRPSMKYIDDHDAIHKKSNKDAGVTDGEDEEMVDAEPVDSKSELTLVQVAISVHIVDCKIGIPHMVLVPFLLPLFTFCCLRVLQKDW